MRLKRPCGPPFQTQSLKDNQLVASQFGKRRGAGFCKSAPLVSRFARVPTPETLKHIITTTTTVVNAIFARTVTEL